MFRSVAIVAVFGAVLVAGLPVAAAETGIEVGDGGESFVVDSGSELTSLGDFRANITGAAEADVVGGSGGTFAFPINLTVIGRPYVHRPESPDAWDDYCFIVRYSTVTRDGAEEAQTNAYNRYRHEEETEYYDDAEADWIQDHVAWEEAVAWVTEENEERAANGETLLEPPSEPQRPRFPLEPCTGEPATVPDLTPAFDAAAQLIREIDPASPRIAPGRGITGVTGFLETGRSLTVSEEQRTLPALGWDISDIENHTPISGTVSFEGQGEFTVDWGDDTGVEGPFEKPGVAYGQPGFAITHAYQHTGDHTITVTDSWRVSMRVTFLGEEFIFTHRETFAPQSMTFPVGEVRSVRER